MFRGTSSISKMTNKDNTMRFPVFHGTGNEYAQKHYFTCEAIQYVKRIVDEESKIVQLETTFRDRALTWYMKYKATAPAGQEKNLTDIKKDLLTEFHKPISESQCII